MEPQRIVSLLPSSTEIVWALGLAERLVGVSHECDFPPEVRGRPVLTEAKITPEGDSLAIDHQIRYLLQEGLGVYRIKTDVLQTLRPDLIVTQDQCEVCAVSLGEVEAAARTFLGSDVRILSLHPRCFADIGEDISRVAAATDRSQEGEKLLAHLHSRIGRVKEVAKKLRDRPRVACIEWIDPPMAAGNWIPEMVDMAGGTYELASPGQHSPALSWEELTRYAPEIVVIMPCGFTVSQSRADLSRLTARPEWQKLPAVQQGKVYVADGNAYFNRPGPRIVDSLELLAEILHPDLFSGIAPPGSYERANGDTIR